jgi:hypothetical protein
VWCWNGNSDELFMGSHLDCTPFITAGGSWTSMWSLQVYNYLIHVGCEGTAVMPAGWCPKHCLGSPSTMEPIAVFGGGGTALCERYMCLWIDLAFHLSCLCTLHTSPPPSLAFHLLSSLILKHMLGKTSN